MTRAVSVRIYGWVESGCWSGLKTLKKLRKSYARRSSAHESLSSGLSEGSQRNNLSLLRHSLIICWTTRPPIRYRDRWLGRSSRSLFAFPLLKVGPMTSPEDRNERLAIRVQRSLRRDLGCHTLSVMYPPRASHDRRP